jgi:DNA-binding NarL/FixJ family response regulator
MKPIQLTRGKSRQVPGASLIPRVYALFMMRILLADDQPEVRSALRTLLEQEAGPWTVAGEAATAGRVLEEVSERRCDVVLLDWELPGLHPAADKAPVWSDGRVLSAIRFLHPELLVIAFSARPEARRESKIAGADEWVSRHELPEALTKTLRKLAQGTWVQAH